eukprot:g3762.t1
MRGFRLPSSVDAGAAAAAGELYDTYFGRPTSATDEEQERRTFWDVTQERFIECTQFEYDQYTTIKDQLTSFMNYRYANCPLDRFEMLRADELVHDAASYQVRESSGSIAVLVEYDGTSGKNLESAEEARQRHVQAGRSHKKKIKTKTKLLEKKIKTKTKLLETQTKAETSAKDAFPASVATKTNSKNASSASTRAADSGRWAPLRSFSVLNHYVGIQQVAGDRVHGKIVENDARGAATNSSIIRSADAATGALVKEMRVYDPSVVGHRHELHRCSKLGRAGGLFGGLCFAGEIRERFIQVPVHESLVRSYVKCKRLGQKKKWVKHYLNKGMPTRKKNVPGNAASRSLYNVLKRKSSRKLQVQFMDVVAALLLRMPTTTYRVESKHAIAKRRADQSAYTTSIGIETLSAATTAASFTGRSNILNRFSNKMQECLSKMVQTVKRAFRTLDQHRKNNQTILGGLVNFATGAPLDYAEIEALQTQADARTAVVRKRQDEKKLRAEQALDFMENTAADAVNWEANYYGRIVETGASLYMQELMRMSRGVKETHGSGFGARAAAAATKMKYSQNVLAPAISQQCYRILDTPTEAYGKAQHQMTLSCAAVEAEPKLFKSLNKYYVLIRPSLKKKRKADQLARAQAIASHLKARMEEEEAQRQAKTQKKDKKGQAKANAGEAAEPQAHRGAAGRSGPASRRVEGGPASSSALGSAPAAAGNESLSARLNDEWLVNNPNSNRAQNASSSSRGLAASTKTASNISAPGAAASSSGATTAPQQAAATVSSSSSGGKKKAGKAEEKLSKRAAEARTEAEENLVNQILEAEALGATAVSKAQGKQKRNDSRKDEALGLDKENDADEAYKLKQGSTLGQCPDSCFITPPDAAKDDEHVTLRSPEFVVMKLRLRERIMEAEQEERPALAPTPKDFAVSSTKRRKPPARLQKQAQVDDAAAPSETEVKTRSRTLPAGAAVGQMEMQMKL